MRSGRIMLLVGDVGGTKTDLAVITLEAGPRAPLALAEFPSASSQSLEAIVREFLGGVGAHQEQAAERRGRE